MDGNTSRERGPNEADEGLSHDSPKYPQTTFSQLLSALQK